MEQMNLTVKEAAAILRISASTLYRLLRENKAPHMTFGTRKVIPSARFYEWMDSEVKGS